jgi:hypothetical protein
LVSTPTNDESSGLAPSVVAEHGYRSLLGSGLARSLVSLGRLEMSLDARKGDR